MKPLMKKVSTMMGIKTSVEEYLYLIRDVLTPTFTTDTGEEWYHNEADTFTLKYKGKVVDAKDIELVIEEKS